MPSKPGLPHGDPVVVQPTRQESAASASAWPPLTAGSDSLFRLLFEQSLNATLIVATDGAILDANGAASRLFAVPLEVLRLTPWSRLLAEAAPEPGRTPTADGAHHVVRLRRWSGEVFTGVVVATAFRDLQGRDCALCLIRDTSERHMLAAVLESSEHAIYTTDLNGHIRNWSRGAAILFGYGEEEAVGRGVFMLAPLGLASEMERNLSLIREGGHVEHYETVRQTRDGRLISVSVAVAPVRDDAGQVIGAAAIARDITERKRAERARQETEERFRRLAENAPDIIFRFRNAPDPAFEYVSPAVHAITGYAPDDLYADPQLLVRMAHPDDRQQIEEIMRQGPQSYDAPLLLRWTRRDGGLIWVELRVVPVREAGQLIAIEGVARDVTATRRTEQEIRDTRDWLRLALSAANMGLFDRDLRSGVISMTPELAMMMGFEGSVRELSFDRWRSLIHADDMARMLVLHDDLATGRRDAFEAEFRVRTRSGDVKWLFSAGRVVAWDDAGQPLRVLGTISDLTQLREAERARQDMEERHWALFETMAQGAIYQDAAGEILGANPAAARILGVPLENLHGRGAADPLLRAIREDGSELPPAEHPSLVALRTGREVDGVILGVQDAREKRRRWLLVHARPQFRPGQTQPYQVYTTFTDITALRAAQDALLESEEKYRAIVESAPDIIARFDGAMRCLYVSPSIARYDGLPAASTEAATQRCQTFFAEHYSRIEEAVTRVFREAATGDVELSRVAPDGQRQHFICRLHPEFDAAGEVRTAVCIAQDVTARRRLEEQARQSQRMDAVGRLAGGVAHDFNNLITGIKGYSSFLAAGLPLGDPRREDAEEIQKAADRAATLTQQLLAFSRRQVMRPRDLDIVALVEGVVPMMRRLIGDDIELAVRLPDSPALVHADPAQLDQVLLNLAVNARDAMPGGGRLEVRVSTLRVAPGEEQHLGQIEAGEFAVIAVSDTGAGIPEGERAHIFEPFASGGTEQGSGLGLSSVYGIVKQSGGHIFVSSEPGLGTTFRIYLPRLLAGAAAAASTADVHGRGEIVLLVEDDDVVRPLAARTLRGVGYQVVEARDGAQAIERSASLPHIDLVLTDIIMPGMNGRELAHALAQSHPELAVLFMSGYTDEVATRQGMLEPGDALLEKPFTPASLVARVRETLQQGQTGNAPA